MSRLLPSPALLTLVAVLGLGVGTAAPQDDAKKSEKLPFPRVVSDPLKAKPKEEPAAKKEDPKEVKKEDPKKIPGLTFDRVPEKPANKKDRTWGVLSSKYVSADGLSPRTPGR